MYLLSYQFIEFLTSKERAFSHYNLTLQSQTYRSYFSAEFKNFTNWQATVKKRKIENLWLYAFYIDIARAEIFALKIEIMRRNKFFPVFLFDCSKASTNTLFYYGSAQDLFGDWAVISTGEENDVIIRRCSLRITLLLSLSDESCLVLDVINLSWRNYDFENCIYFCNSKFHLVNRPRGIIYQNDKICMLLTILCFHFQAPTHN